MEHNFDPVTNWIQKAPYAEGVRWFPLDDEVLVDAPSIETAAFLMDTLDSQPPFTIAQKCVVIRHAGRVYGTSSRACKLQEGSHRSNKVNDSTQIDDQLISEWVRDNPQLWRIQPGCAIVYKNDRDADYPCAEVKFQFSERQLNKPRKELLGRPVGTWDDPIAIPRRAAIERLLESGEPQTVTYENFWESLTWVLKSEVLLLPSDEILVTVEEGALWQKGYWQAIAEQEARTTSN